MAHLVSDLDRCLQAAFESATLDMQAFHHREHVRLAYIYLASNGVSAAANKIRTGLLNMLVQNGIDQSQYHETLTMAWMQEIKHYMFLSPDTPSSEAFIDQNPGLLDKEMMFFHYSREVINQDKSRAEFVSPDLQPIPEHAVLSR